METQKPKNPKAFPTLLYNEVSGEPNGHEQGMTLRDYFANSAMQKCVSYKPKGFYNWLKWFLGFNYEGTSVSAKVIAENAYIVADAMLKQREL